MEPPAKRRRQYSSPFGRRPHTDDDGDHDELQGLSPSPPPHHDHDRAQSQSQSLDEGYQLATKRIEANQRLEATFAHIIEKYSHDFEGIGDEIDMETGEIVVDNGHLTGMRNEGDLGGGWTDVDGADEYDEGFMLEDLPDHLFEDGDQQETNQDKSSPPNDDDADMNKENSNSESAVDKGKEGDDTSVEEVPTAAESATNSGAANMQVSPWHLQPASVSPFAPKMYGNFFVGFLPAFGAFSAEAAGLKSQLGAFMSASNSGNPPPPNGQCPFPLMLNPWAMAGLLQPEAWAQPNGNMQLPQSWGQPSPALEPELPSLPSLNKPQAERYKFPVQKGRTSIWAPSSRLENDEDRAPKRGPRSTGQASSPRVGDKNKKASDQSNVDGDANRRMSGRIRKQTEYMGKVSWSEADKMARSTPSRSSQPSSPNPKDRGDPDAEDELAMDDIVTTAISSQTSARNISRKSVTEQGRVIPDSQDSATPPTSSVPQTCSQVKDQQAKVDPPAPRDPTPSLALSDDEAPILLPRPKAIVAEVTSTEAEPEAQVQQEKDSPKPNPQPEANTAVNLPKRRGRGRPRKSLTSEHSTDLVGTPAKPLAREIKILRETMSDSPRFALPHKTESPSREQGGKRLRSSRRRNSTKPPEKIADEPREDDVHSTVSCVGPKAAANVESMVDSAKDAGSKTNPPAIDTKSMTDPPAHVESIIIDAAMAVEPMPDPTAEDPPRGPEPASSPRSTIPATDDGTSVNNTQEEPATPSKQDPLSSAPSPPSTKPPPPPTTPIIPRPSPNTPRKPPPPSSSPSSLPRTPRNTTIRTARAPSSRRSLLSLVSTNNSDSESDDSLDELNRPQPSLFSSRSSAKKSTIKRWRSSDLTREVFRTPVKRRPGDPVSPGSVIKTPGGTVRTCGIDDFQCGRDFCFNCL